MCRTDRPAGFLAVSCEEQRRLFALQERRWWFRRGRQYRKPTQLDSPDSRWVDLAARRHAARGI